MKSFLNKFLMIALLATLFACDDDEVLEDSYMQVNTEELSFDNQVTQKIRVMTNGRWNAKVLKGGSNFTIEPTQGMGPDEITVTMDRTSAKAINGLLQLNYLDEKEGEAPVSRKIALTAEKMDIVSVDDLTFSRTLHSIPVDINYAGAWTAELGNTEFYSIDNTSGEGYGRINVTMAPGNSAKATEMTIKLAEYPKLRVTVSISYEGIVTYKILNKATVGKGIDIVVVGDGFRAEDMAEGGRWDQACQMFMESYFKNEPMKSFKDWFNVYAVADECDYDLWDMTESRKTKFGTYHPAPTWPGYVNTLVDRRIVYKFAYENTPVKEERHSIRDLTVALLVNSNQSNIGGTAQSNEIDQDPGCGIAMAAFSIFVHGDTPGKPTSQPGSYSHEFIGHGFGGFHENYVNKDKKDKYFEFNDKWPVEYFQNIQRQKQTKLDIQYDSGKPEDLVNTTWRELYEMGYRNVEIIEGACTYGHGAYRSSYWNAMCSAPSSEYHYIYNYYSPVQREIIVRRIYKLAGMADQYNLDVFLEYDKRNEQLDNDMIEWGKTHPREY